ncbi:hypothetical protein B0T09DRAFT_393582 [Sordaria sp. MPI-SDFR-AT-0083]|nr:hypothetical protein B0T09DRAFT_393582 [Sordaria sp. MPI-SDFR-AT-0083]
MAPLPSTPREDAARMCTQTVLTTRLCKKCGSPMSNAKCTSPCGGIGHMSPCLFGRGAAPEPNKRALYVGGLNPRVTEDVLRQDLQDHRSCPERQDHS